MTHALLKAGAPFSVLDNGSEIRVQFEDGHCSVKKDSCSSFIPALNDLEADLTMTEIRAANGFSICSDGTMNVAECLAIVSDGLLHLIMMIFKILWCSTGRMSLYVMCDGDLRKQCNAELLDDA